MSEKNQTTDEGVMSFDELVADYTREQGLAPQPEVEEINNSEEDLMSQAEELEKGQEEETTEEENTTENQSEVEETPEEEVKTEKDKPTPNTFNYASFVKKQIEKGKWKDAIIEDAEGNEVKLSEMEDLDEETFYQVQDSQEAFSKEDIETNYIPTKDLDDRKKKVLDIVSKGGDLKEIFKSEEGLKQYLHPYEGVDLEDEQVQSNILYNDLLRRNVSDKVARAAVKEAQEDLTLDTKAKEIIDNVNKQFDNYVAAEEKKIEQKAETEKAEAAQYRKDLTKSFKEAEFKDNDVKRYVDLATKKDKDGNYAVDTLFNEYMEDPKKAVQLVAFLDDPDKFLKRYKDTAKTEATKEHLRTIKLIQNKDRKAPVEEIKKEKTNEIIPDFIN